MMQHARSVPRGEPLVVKRNNVTNINNIRSKRADLLTLLCHMDRLFSATGDFVALAPLFAIQVTGIFCVNISLYHPGFRCAQDFLKRMRVHQAEGIMTGELCARGGG